MEPRYPADLASSREMAVLLVCAAHLGTKGLDVMLNDLEVESNGKTSKLIYL